ncbi:hypothetical protein FY528_17345 [Hymenobacter lutimineralis]|uniref:Uncharacterized protein n=1 Tax=Hymenobacter lutimineralis TaxID=2606448 RepID=A0A5D6UW72_9BACT|nr:hypothetical protein [Hymenobacter lutimineralis]TYZ06634.1 hypothetical protein FY528_17345 [Hymenobacter lutimineralis]
MVIYSYSTLTMTIVRLFLLGILFLPGGRAKAQKQEPPYRMRRGGIPQVKRILIYETVEKPSPGFANLRANVSTEKLLRLAQQSNPAMRLYAALALADRKYPKLYEVFGEIIRSDQRVTLQLTHPDNGRVFTRKTYPSSELYDRFYYSGRYQKLTAQDSASYTFQLLKLDSVALTLASQGYPIDWRTEETACYTNNAYPGSYAAIRKLCLDLVETKYGSAPLAHALASYREKADVPLIARFEQWSLWAAVTQFPDPALWPLLQPYVGKESDYRFYAAVASYQNQAAAHLLDSIYRHRLYYDDGAGRRTLSELAQALSNHYHPVFDSLIVQLWWQQQLITPAEVTLFTKRDEKKAAAIFTRGLLGFSPTGNSFLVSYESGLNTERLMSNLLLPILQHDSLTFRAVTFHGLSVFGDKDLAALCGIIRQHHLTWAASALLTRLSAEERAFDLFTISETLLSIGNADVHRRTRELLLKKPVQEFIGKWPVSFDKLLKSYNLTPLSP